MSAEPLRTLREHLAEAEIAEEAAEDAFTVAKAQAEVQAQIDLERSTITKMPEATQKRWITAALPKNEAYVAALAALRNAHAQVLRLRAQLDAERDARRDKELTVQKHLLYGVPRDKVRLDVQLVPTSRTPSFDVENHR